MRVAEADILILPGLGDSGDDHWQTRWRQKLSTARKVEQLDWLKPLAADWTQTIARAIGESGRRKVVVAHSLGVVAFLHVAGREAEKIAGAFLVAPPSEEALRDLVEPGFLPIPRARVKFPATIVGADNDPLSPAPFARELAADIGATFLDAGASGHINVESGHGPWPEGSMAFAHFLAPL